MTVSELLHLLTHALKEGDISPDTTVHIVKETATWAEPWRPDVSIGFLLDAYRVMPGNQIDLFIEEGV